ncbi:WXG100 family type VII secretion target [Actinocorallia herbida]|uniref:WXG100 family type VII secretion target n=1 Tax=Actinocorallia herbida TaxID=58109 RepID=A0A3N1D9D7_9ACTN|nr:WXG100 family type VII secretion target [Actinocorallia herbida]ROO90106.1 WXG100 family type VII secretion target [Actinocorallia herbida]
MGADRRGGNMAQMEDLARLFSRHSKNLDALINDLNGRTVGSNEIWWGPRADRFRAAWAEAKSAFDKMAVALEEGATDVRQSVQNIEAATR